MPITRYAARRSAFKMRSSSQRGIPSVMRSMFFGLRRGFFHVQPHSLSAFATRTSPYFFISRTKCISLSKKCRITRRASGTASPPLHSALGSLARSIRSRTHFAPPKRSSFSRWAGVMRRLTVSVSSPAFTGGLPWPLPGPPRLPGDNFCIHRSEIVQRHQ